jgi:subtilisin-like proprotein convertase family protein
MQRSSHPTGFRRALWPALLVVVILLVSSASGAIFTNPGHIVIRDSTPATAYPSTLNVAAMTGTITDVDVKLNGLSHGKMLDVDVLLVGPAGENVVLMSDVGAPTAVSNVDVTIDDAAASSMPLNPAQLTTGTYKPTNTGSGFDSWSLPAPIPSGYPTPNLLLSTFNGTDPNGTWSLYVVDDAANGTGSIGEWQLLITTTGTVQTTFTQGTDITINDLSPAPPADVPGSPYPSTVNVSGVAGTITQMSVTLTGFSHSFPTDTDVLLVAPTSPATKNAIVFSDVGSQDNAVNLTFTLSDSAGSPLPSSGALSSGTFQPTNNGAGDVLPAPAPTPAGGSALSVFTGMDPNGTWSLYVADDESGDGGCFCGGWALDISGPTAVGVARMTAARRSGGVLVRWRTASEAQTAGFNLYRGKAKVNRSLIAAKHAGQARGATYEILDKRAKARTSYNYRLEAIRLDASRATAGSTALRFSR